MTDKNNELYMCLCDKCKQQVLDTDICPNEDRCLDYQEYLKDNDPMPSGEPAAITDCEKCWGYDKGADHTLYAYLELFGKYLCEQCKAMILQYYE